MAKILVNRDINKIFEINDLIEFPRFIFKKLKKSRLSALHILMNSISF